MTISLQAGWAVTPASGPTGQSECYRAGSRWPSWCHTDSQIGFNCQGWSLAQWVCGGRGTPGVAGLKIEPDEERRDLTHLNGHAQRISLSHPWTHTHRHIKLTQSKSLQGCVWRQRRWRDFTRGLALLSCLPLWLTVSTAMLTAHSLSLTHTRKQTHTHTHRNTIAHPDSLSSSGHDCQSSECAALTSVDRTVCHALSTSVCAVRGLDVSINSPQICLLYMCLTVRGRHYRVPMCSMCFPGHWVEKLDGFNRYSSTPPTFTYFIVSVQTWCVLVCLHAHMHTSQVTCTCTCASTGVCEHLSLQNQLLQSDRGNAERLAISWRWKRWLTSFARVLTHPRTADTSSHTEAGKQSAMETHSLGSCGGEDELL